MKEHIPPKLRSTVVKLWDEVWNGIADEKTYKAIMALPKQDYGLEIQHSIQKKKSEGVGNFEELIEAGYEPSLKIVLDLIAPKVGGGDWAVANLKYFPKYMDNCIRVLRELNYPPGVEDKVRKVISHLGSPPYEQLIKVAPYLWSTATAIKELPKERLGGCWLNLLEQICENYDPTNELIGLSPLEKQERKALKGLWERIESDPSVLGLRGLGREGLIEMGYKLEGSTYAEKYPIQLKRLEAFWKERAIYATAEYRQDILAHWCETPKWGEVGELIKNGAKLTPQDWDQLFIASLEHSPEIEKLFENKNEVGKIPKDRVALAWMFATMNEVDRLRPRVVQRKQLLARARKENLSLDAVPADVAIGVVDQAWSMPTKHQAITKELWVRMVQDSNPKKRNDLLSAWCQLQSSFSTYEHDEANLIDALIYNGARPTSEDWNAVLKQRDMPNSALKMAYPVLAVGVEVPLKVIHELAKFEQVESGNIEDFMLKYASRFGVPITDKFSSGLTKKMLEISQAKQQIRVPVSYEVMETDLELN